MDKRREGLSSSKRTRDRRTRSRSPRENDRRHSNRGYLIYNGIDKRKINSAKEVKRGIEMAKDRLKTSLTAAIGHNSTREPGSSDAYPRRVTNDYIPVDLTESVARQSAIEQIEEPGFTPALFKSDANSARKKNKKIAAGMSNKIDGKEALATHDRAMFGPIWVSKQIEKKQMESSKHQNQNKLNDKESPTTLRPKSEKLETSNNYPLAHENLSENPDIRNQRWLNLWRERRKMALEGAL